MPASLRTGSGGGGPPTGAAGGVLGGTFPNPAFAADQATQAELDAASASLNTAVAAHGIVLPAPSGGDDRDAINAVIAAVAATGGGVVRGRAGAVYKISGPVLVQSAIELDMTGCTIQFTTTSIQTNLLQNAVVTPVETAADADTVAGSSVVNSPLLAAEAVEGQQMAVELAGAVPGSVAQGYATKIWLYGTIEDITGNDITLGGNANGVAAHTTLTNATAHLFDRDANIKITGGIWDAGTNWNVMADRYLAAADSNLLRFRRVDGLVVRGVTTKQTGFPQGGGWCFGINPGDCTDFLFEECQADGSSTCVQGDGPLSRGTVRNISGMSRDDQVAFGTVGAADNDVEGDISDIIIDGVYANESLRTVTLFAGDGSNGVARPMTGATARGCKGTTLVDSVRVVNYAGDAEIECELADITAVPTDPVTYSQVQVSTGQPGIVVVGPKTGRELALAFKTANQGLTTSMADLTDLEVTFVGPPSGAVYLEAWFYTVQQLTTAGAPTLMIADEGNVSQQTMLCGTLAINAFSVSIKGKVKITGLISGDEYTYKCRGRTSASTATLNSSTDETWAYLRAVAA